MKPRVGDSELVRVMALLATSSTGEAERGRSLGLAGLARLMSVGPMSNHVSKSKVEA